MSSTVESIRKVYQNLRGRYGQLGLQAVFPNEFEAYMIALELVNSDGEVVDYFTFPINPSQLAEVSKRITSIRKTLGGVSIHSTEKFIPTEISMQGTFGRKLKFLVGDDLINFAGLSFGFGGNGRFKFGFNKNASSRELTRQIKTGYGCFKVLEAICNRSDMLDDKGKPYELYLYNLALGNSYLVKVLDLTASQSESTNQLWNYNLVLKSIAPLQQVRKNAAIKLMRAAAGGFLQNTANAQMPSLLGMLDGKDFKFRS